jgi:hypothetical protein
MIAAPVRASSERHGERIAAAAASAFSLTDRFVMADHFPDNEVEEFLRKIGIEMGIVGEPAKARDLLRFARRIGRRQTMRRLVLSDCLGAFEPLGQQMDKCRVDIVYAFAQALKFRIGGSHGYPLFLVGSF